MRTVGEVAPAQSSLTRPFFVLLQRNGSRDAGSTPPKGTTPALCPLVAAVSGPVTLGGHCLWRCLSGTWPPSQDLSYLPVIRVFERWLKQPYVLFQHSVYVRSISSSLVFFGLLFPTGRAWAIFFLGLTGRWRHSTLWGLLHILTF